MNANNKKSEIESRIQVQIDAIKRGCAELIKEDELYEKLSYSITQHLPLKIKAGFDPTSPDIHLGHTVLLNKLRTFQEYGHQVFFIIGDFTAMIGDPTGKSETRKPLSKEEVLKNSETYKEQAFKILMQEKTKILFNSWWLSDLNLADFIKISSNYTVARMLEKDDFEKRFKDSRPIAIHEFIYPLLQGIDSVFIKCDLELGGNDQKFNLVVGRELMKSSGLPPQVVMTMPLLEGLDGKNKMSKSLGNSIGVSDGPNDMFGKIMSISDEMMIKYYELLSSISNPELNLLKKEINEGTNPIYAKKKLALEIVETYHSKSLAEKALKYFEDKYQSKKTPEDIAIIKSNKNVAKIPDTDISSSYAAKNMTPSPQILFSTYKIDASLFTDSGAVSSNSELKRRIKEGAIKINFEVNNNPQPEITLRDFPLRIQMPSDLNEFILKVGKKKIYKIILNSAKKA